MSRITWSDVQEATPQELKKIYKVSDRELEAQLRNHLYGANTQERRKYYQKLYEGNKLR